MAVKYRAISVFLALAAVFAGSSLLGSSALAFNPDGGSAATQQSPYDCTGSWAKTASPNMMGTNYLTAVSSSGPRTAWAVGYGGFGPTYQTLTETWNGSNWSLVPSPSSGAGSNLLEGVAVVSNVEAWAVGHVDTVAGISQTLLMRWNGHQWTIYPLSLSGGLWSVTAVNKNDVWSVGYTGASGSHTPLILHWNGVDWRKVASPVYGSESYLRAISTRGKNDIWAVGEQVNDERFGEGQTLALHWNGVKWTKVPSSAAGSLEDVTIVGQNDVWAVGYGGTRGSFHTLAQHWNGHSWSVTSSLDSAIGNNVLAGVVALAPNRIIAIGQVDPINGGLTKTIVERWDGHQWTLDPYSVAGTATSATALDVTHIVSVGYTGNYDSYQTLMETGTYCRRNLTPTPTTPRPNAPTGNTAGQTQ